MRMRSLVVSLLVAVPTSMIALPALPAFAASATCAALGAPECVAGQQCRVIGAATTGTCVWEATDAQTLIDAIVAAHADVERDVIFVGNVDPVDDQGTPLPGPVGAEIHLDTALADDGGAFGPRALPKIRSAITIEGLSQQQSIIDIDADIRMFLLEVDPVANRRPDLLLKNLTLRDARPAEGATGAGAVTVRNTPTTAVDPELPELPLVTVEDVVFVGGRGGTATAGAIHNEGAPLRIDGATFDQNSAGGALAAGAVLSTTGGVILSSDFLDNRGVGAGALSVPNATRADEAGDTVDVTLQVNATTFEGNQAEGGAVFSLASSNTFGNNQYRENVANNGSGGAIAARGLRITAGVFEDNVARQNGGAIAIIDEPASGPIQIAGADFVRNRAFGDGGAVHHVGATLVVDQCFFTDNRANGVGGALSISGLLERNAAEADARISNNDFRSNAARPLANLSTVDVQLDERGTDLGTLGYTFKGKGAAIGVSAGASATGGTTVITDNCIHGNGADAVVIATTPASVDASGNWWGDASGPGPDNLGDVVGSGVGAASPAGDALTPCIDSGEADYPLLFVPAVIEEPDVSDGFATIVEDFTMLDIARGIQVMNGPAGDLVPDTRLGVLNIEVRGVNDVEDEPNESALFTIIGCSDIDCVDYVTDSGFAATLTISDNGDGSEGEGEGEGEVECEEVLSLSASALEFDPADVASAEPGTPVERTLTITNDSTCDVQMLRPFVQAGASQGFAVKPILQSALLLTPGASIDVVATYTEPAEPAEPAEGEEGITGNLRIESAGGFLFEVPLTLVQGCSCSTTPQGSGGGGGSGVPWAALVLVGFGLLRALHKPRRIP